MREKDEKVEVAKAIFHDQSIDSFQPIIKTY